jgi:hypothetical protein
MTKIITILIGCSLALAVSVRAEQDDKNKQKNKQVQKKQFTPQQHTNGANTHVQTTPKYKNPSLQNNAKIHAQNQHLNTLPAVQSNHTPHVNPNNLTVHPNNLTVHPNNPVIDPKFHKNVTNFQPKHQNFHAQVNSSIVSAKFNQNYHIKNAQNWNGSHYTVFKNYHPQWHDKGWWHSHHNHVVLIGGGWYFWNAGYWYPAWGYDNSAAYYPYDGPIYVGNSPKPFDEIVADVQSTLQEQGYYHGDIDGLVGPLTQEALASYQSAQGLEPTAAIDQPTLESLGMG